MGVSVTLGFMHFAFVRLKESQTLPCNIYAIIDIKY